MLRREHVNTPVLKHVQAEAKFSLSRSPILTMVSQRHPLFRGEGAQKVTRPSTLLNLNEGSATALQLHSEPPNCEYFGPTFDEVACKTTLRLPAYVTRAQGLELGMDRLKSRSSEFRESRSEIPSLPRNCAGLLSRQPMKFLIVMPYTLNTHHAEEPQERVHGLRINTKTVS